MIKKKIEMLLILYAIISIFNSIHSDLLAQYNPDFTVPINVKIGNNQFELKIGCRENATNGFDNGLDVITAPPGFNAYAYFWINEFPNILKEDYRKSGQEAQWSLHIANAASDSSFLSWDSKELIGEDQLFLNNSINMLIDTTASFFGNQHIIITYQPNTSSVEKSYGETTKRSFRLYQNYPNPFNPTTTIKYQLHKDGKVTLQIYDVLGRLVRTLVNMKQAAGYYDLCWDGKNDRGQSVPAGLYFYGIQAGEFRAVKKLLLIK